MEAPTDQLDVAREAERECASEIDGSLFDVNPENAELAYDNNIRALNCLRENGYPTADPPSKSSYVNQFLEDRSTITWDPYDEIPIDERRAAVMTCQQ